MRILIAHSYYRQEGGENYAVDRQVELLGSYHDVGLFVDDNADLAISATAAARMTFSRRQLLRAESVMQEFRPDVVHVHNSYPSIGPAVHLAARRLGIPLVSTVHNFRLRCPSGLRLRGGRACNLCESGRYYNAVVHNCLGSAAQSAGYAAALWAHRFLLRLESTTAIFVVPSEFFRERLAGWGIPESKIRLVRNFVSPGTGPAAPPRTSGLYVGRLAPEKGVGLLLAALARAGDPSFSIVGDGPQRAELERRARDLGLRRTTFLGRVPPERVGWLMAAAGWVVLPSLWEENAPLVAGEAMSLGRPLVVSDKGGLPELVRSGGGLVFRAGDQADLAAKLLLLMNDP
ncbi:MAG: glycosyltransferase, partial [Actinomycetota bacterium]